MTSNTQAQTRAIVPTQAQIELDSSMVRTLAGKRAVLFTTFNGETVYTSLRLLTDNETGKIATLENDTIKFQHVFQFTPNTPIVIEFQTMQYGQANKFVNAVFTLEARMVERKSKTYYAAIKGDGSVAWFKRTSGEYSPVTPVDLALGEHFKGNNVLMGLVQYWTNSMKLITDESAKVELDKRKGMVGDKLSAYGAWLIQNGKQDSSIKAYATKHGLSNAELLTAYNKPTLTANVQNKPTASVDSKKRATRKAK